MQIIEVKNNLVKISYDSNQEPLALSGFVVIKDEVQSFVSQVMHLEGGNKGSFAILKMIFNFDSQGVVTGYNGTAPSMQSVLQQVNSQEIISLIEVKNPVVIGELAQQDSVLKLDREIFEDKLLVCSDKSEEWQTFSANTLAQLKHQGKKVVIFDLDGDCDLCTNKVVAGVDFKLPLNYETINFIYDNGLDDASAESRALIQDVFLEVQNYVKTLEEKYIPFENFKSVVDAQYEESGLIELVLLKNKLLKYNENGIFAQGAEEFLSLNHSLSQKEATIFDLSRVDEIFQREMIAYAYSCIKDGVYVVLKLSNKNSDKKLLKQIFGRKNVFTTFVCPYSYKYLTEIKQLVKNMVFFSPIIQQNDFASYNVLMNKLNPDEFVLYGKASHHIPFIVKLSDLAQNSFEGIQQEYSQEDIAGYEQGFEETNEQIPVEHGFEPAQETIEEIEEVEQGVEQGGEISSEEQIMRDVDVFYTKPKTQIAQEQEYDQQITNEDLTDEDLDFLEELNLADKVEFSEGAEDVEEAEVLSEQSQESDYDENIVDELPEPDDLQAQSFDNQELLSEQEAPSDFRQTMTQLEDEEFAFQANGENNFSEDLEVFEEMEPPAVDILPASVASTPMVPIYSADDGDSVQEVEKFGQGDEVFHNKYGKGVVEKIINYGSKSLCSINFDNVGRRLLDPAVSELKRV